MLLGLRTIVYYVTDIEEAKNWYTKVLGIKPYYDTPYYVGYSVGGYELGLHPGKGGSSEKETGSVAYWGVSNIEIAFKHLILMGATPHSEIQDVGENIQVAAVLDPFGNILGIIENPNFSLP